MRDFDGAVVVVTGASSDIGRAAAAIEFAERGALVYGAGLNTDSLAETEALVARAGGKARLLHTDVSVEAEVAAFLARVASEAGRPGRGVQQRRNHRWDTPRRRLPRRGIRACAASERC